MKKFCLLLSMLLIVSLIPMNKAFAEEKPVRMQGTGDLYASLEEAVAAANMAGSGTIEIIGDVAVASDISVTADVTIIGAEGPHIVTVPSSYRIFVKGGRLTLGGGADTDPLTISSMLPAVSAASGAVSVNDGVTLTSSNSYALELNGPDVTASISGGSFEGNGAALSMEKGAHIKEISGGVFRGKNDAVHLTDDSRQGTSIDRISGGEFYQTQTESGLHGVALFVQNYARVGEISGGYFEAARNQALTVIRGGRIDEVSGGEFTTKRTGTYVAQIYNSEASYPTSSIGTISGGYFHGGDYGIWSIGRNGDDGTEIGSITGGKFESKTSLQNDSHSVIGSISGGIFTGGLRGLFNAGDIGEISGTVEIVGNGDGIYNYMGGTIGEISGGTIIATHDTFSEALVNSGTIGLISGGTIIGEWSAINSEYGKIDTISDGVFWGKSSFAICVGQALKLEPGLGESSRKGVGRYQSGGGQPIFEKENLVAYPVNPQLNIPWSMSSATETEAVEGIPDVGFRYLVLPVWDLMYDANIPGGADGSAVTLPGSQMGIDADNASAAVGSPKGTPTAAAVTYGFAGWNTQADGLGTPYEETDAVPAQPDGTVVTLYAQWTQKPVTTCAIVYNGNGNTGGKVPVDARSPYARGSIVTILGRNNMTKENYTFKGWATTAAGEVAYAPAQTFSIVADTTLYAVWKSNASPKTGEGSNMTGWIVALVASALGMLSIFLCYKRRQRKGMKQ